MTIEKPKPKIERVHVTARDPDGDRPSKTVTLYDTTPEQVIAAVEDAARRLSRKPKSERNAAKVAPEG